MIPQKNISLISNKTAKGSGKRIPEGIIERDYCLAWFISGISQSPIKKYLVFKGGTALRRCYFKDYRFSEDLEFTLIKEVPLEYILKEFKNIFSYVKEETGINFAQGKQEVTTKNTHTFYITYVGPLPGKEKEVRVDITYRETIVTAVEERAIIRSYDEFSDFSDDVRVNVYSLKEIAIEKVCALLSPARNEPRDLYDIWYLIENEELDLSLLVSEISRKLEFKGHKLDTMKEAFLKKEKRLRKLWNVRLLPQMSVLPEYESVYRVVKRAFRQAGIID